MSDEKHSTENGDGIAKKPDLSTLITTKFLVTTSIGSLMAKMATLIKRECS